MSPRNSRSAAKTRTSSRLKASAAPPPPRRMAGSLPRSSRSTIPQRKGDPIIVDKDEHPRETSVEKLSQLKPIVQPDGSVTAGNASGVNDGAAAIIIASQTAIDAYGLTPRARILGAAVAGVPPRIMGIGPAPASEKLMKRLGLKIGDFDVIELNEAFAAQGLAVLRMLGLPDDAQHVNPNGGAIALGHPLGMSGARLALTATEELAAHRRQARACHHVHRRWTGNRARARTGVTVAMATVASTIDEAAIMAAIADVPDPEIPVLTITDLGIVRGFVTDPPRVQVSPTYTGCPATVAIEHSIREALDKAGLEEVHIERVLFPPWTTDWITERGRERLRPMELHRQAPSATAQPAPNADQARPRKSAALARPRARRSGAAHPVSSRSNASNATERLAHHSAKLPSSLRKIGLRQRCRSLSASRTAASSMSTPRPGPSGTGR